MFLKRIQAPTLGEALEKAKKECGDNALLVETRPTRKGYLVIAGRPTEAADLPLKSAPGSPVRWTRGFRPLAEEATRFGIGTRILKAVENALVGTRVDVSQPGAPALPGLAARVLKALISTTALDGAEHRVQALVGPTGVGKTTTLAKLAAMAVQKQGESVAILSLDTYRMAAVEQMRAFADMMHVPFEVVFTPLDLRRAVQQHSQADRIFIDTTGRSPFDVESLGTLRSTLQGCDPTVLLCIAAGNRRRDAERILRGFESLSPDAAILTKWDETEVPGETLSLLMEKGIAMTHVTVGQEVPRDIVPACAGTLAAAAFGLDEAQAATVL